MKKQPTLQDLFNKMDELQEKMWKRFISLDTKLNILLDKPELEKTSEESVPEIPDSAYVMINDTDAYISSEPVTEYNGKNIYELYYLPAYFKEARDTIREEYGVELLEIHAIQSSTNGEFAKQGTPIPDKNGTCSWCRCVYLDEDNNTLFTPWVFNSAYGSASACSSYCALHCSKYVRDYSGVRAALFAGLKCSKKD